MQLAITPFLSGSVAMRVPGGLQLPQTPGLLHAAPLRGVQQFRSLHACQLRSAQSAQPDARDRGSRSAISCSSDVSNGSLPREQGGPALSQLNGDSSLPAADNGSSGDERRNGSGGAFELDDVPSGLNGSNGSAAVPRPPRLVGAYDSESEEGDAMSELDQRILGGEFTDVGSTKAKITKPARKVLSKGFGPGTLLSQCIRRQARHCTDHKSRWLAACN